MPLSCKRPTLSGAGRNSNCGFSPTPPGRGRQKNGCQESCCTDDGSDRQRSQPKKQTSAPRRRRRGSVDFWLAVVQCIDGCIVAVESAGGVSIAATRFFTAFCTFSKARTSIWRTRSRETANSSARSSSVTGSSRSEEHTSELQSLAYLVCRLLLEKKTKLIHNLYIKKQKKTTKK